MTNLASFMGRRDFVKRPYPKVTLPLPDTYMGIEVEVDQDASTRNTTVFPEDYRPEWTQKLDGSLSNGYEYVLAAPLAGDALVEAVYKLYEAPVRVHRTYTGSTHIHINMMDGTSVDALRTLLLIGYAFEPLLYYVGDNTRQWCGYANRLTDAPSEMLESILGAELSASTFRRSTERAGRYYGMNLDALRKYGTVEFRYFPTATSAEELMKWIKLVQNFKRAAITTGSVDALIEKLKEKSGYNEFVEEYFGEVLEEVSAVTEFARVKALMSKALIIASTNNPRERAPYSYDKLVEKYSKRLVVPSKKSGKSNFVYVFCSRTGALPIARNLGSGESGITAFMYYESHGVYYSRRADWSNGVEWHNISDVVYEDQLFAPTLVEYQYEILAGLQALTPPNRQAEVQVFIASAVSRCSSLITSTQSTNSIEEVDETYDDDDDDYEESEGEF